MGFEIRPAAATDADALAPLASEAARATYAPIAQPAVYETFIAQSCSADALAAAIARAADNDAEHFAVAVEDSTLVGYLDFGRDEDGILELRRLYAAVGATSRGIGAALLRSLEQRLLPGTRYRAIVHARNERGLSFWLRRGFTVQGELDTREHLAAHRGLNFEEPAQPEPSVVLARIVPKNA